MAPKAHSELGASIAARWLACPGSVRLSRGMENVETIHSLNGTAAHAVAEFCLQNNVDPADFIDAEIPIEGKLVDAVLVTEGMADAVQLFVRHCRAIMADPDAEWWIEHPFSLAALEPPAPMFGTSDFIAYSPGLKELEVVDYKHGQGVVVEVKGNKQLRYYALGALLSVGQDLDIETVKITIVQPRAAHPDGPIRSETLTPMELIEFSADLLEGARATQPEDAPLVAGAHCRFCPASPVCPAQRDQTQALAQVAFEVMPTEGPPPPEVIPVEEFWDMLAKLPILENWAAAMRQHAERLATAGEPTPGFKVVEKRATRRWLDEADVVAFLKERGHDDEEIYKRALLSPAQIEKLVGKKNLPVDLYEKKSSGTKLVPQHHPSPALLLSAGEVFEVDE